MREYPLYPFPEEENIKVLLSESFCEYRTGGESDSFQIGFQPGHHPWGAADENRRFTVAFRQQ